MWATVEELEGLVGAQIRQRRLQRNLTLDQVNLPERISHGRHRTRAGGGAAAGHEAQPERSARAGSGS